MISLNELNDSFLSKITDYRLLDMMEDEINDDLFRYFKTARAKFYRCRNRLDVIQNDEGERFFGYKKMNEDTGLEEDVYIEITPFEIEILVAIMLVEHIKPQLLSSENLKQSLSDKDFKIYSQANQLREIRLLMEYYERQANKMITEYTFFDLGKENA